jgi:hypothetical protein
MLWKHETPPPLPIVDAAPKAPDLMRQIKASLDSIRAVAESLDDTAKTSLTLAVIDTNQLLEQLDLARPSNQLSALTSLQQQISDLEQAALLFSRMLDTQFSVPGTEQRLQEGRLGFTAIVSFLRKSSTLIQEGELAAYERHVMSLQASKFAAILK